MKRKVLNKILLKKYLTKCLLGFIVINNIGNSIVSDISNFIVSDFISPVSAYANNINNISDISDYILYETFGGNYCYTIDDNYFYIYNSNYGQVGGNIIDINNNNIVNAEERPSISDGMLSLRYGINRTYYYYNMNDFEYNKDWGINVDKLFPKYDTGDDDWYENGYETVSDFSDGVAWVQEADDKKNWNNNNITTTYLIDKNNKKLFELPSHCRYITNFSDGMGWINGSIEDENHIGLSLIDKSGKTIFETDYTSASIFNEGLCWIQKNDKWGVIDENNNIIIDFIYDNINSYESYINNFKFIDGVSWVKQDNKYGLIDNSNKILVPFEYDDISEFSEEGVAWVQKADAWGLIDNKNNIILPFEYNKNNQSPTVFSEGVSAVKINDKWGYINKNGLIVIEPIFTTASQFIQNRAIVSIVDNSQKDFEDYKGYIIENPFLYDLELDNYSKLKTTQEYLDYLADELGEFSDLQLYSSSQENLDIIQDFILLSLEKCEPVEISINKNDIIIKQENFEDIKQEYSDIYEQITNIYEKLGTSPSDEISYKLSLLEKGLINPIDLETGEVFDAPNLVAYNIITQNVLEFDKDEIAKFNDSSEFYDYLEEKLDLITDANNSESSEDIVNDDELSKSDIEEIENYLNTINDNLPIEAFEIKNNLVSLSEEGIKNLLGEMSNFYDNILNLISDYNISLNKEHEHTLNIALTDINLDDTINFVITSDMVEEFKNHSYIRFIFDELGTNIVLDVQNIIDIFDSFEEEDLEKDLEKDLENSDGDIDDNNAIDDNLEDDDNLANNDSEDDGVETISNKDYLYEEEDDNSNSDDDNLDDLDLEGVEDETSEEDNLDDTGDTDEDISVEDEFKYFQDLQSYEDFEDSNTIEFSLKYNTNHVMFDANTSDLAIYITMPFYTDLDNKNNTSITNPEDITIMANINGEFINWGGQVNANSNTIEFLATSAGSYQVQVTETIINDIDHLDEQLQHIIRFMVSKEFFSTIDDNFYPDGLMTRYDFISSLVKVFFVQDNTLVSKFDDVDISNPYHNIVAAAEYGNITKGYGDNTFRGNILITRETLVSFVGRVLGEQLGYTYPTDIDDTLNIFEDSEDISSWAKNDVSLALSHGIIKIDNSFYPQEEITRVEALEIIYKLFDLLYETPSDDVFVNIANTFNKSESTINKSLLMGIGAGILLSLLFRKRK